MKVVIAGGRDINDAKLVLKGVKDSNFTITEVVSGGAKGIDRIGEKWSLFFLKKEAKVFKYESQFGRAGGPIRNRKMAQYADALIAVWDGKSRGTSNMIEEMKKLNKPVHVTYLEPL
jgi:hypothetical protein